MDGTLTVRTDKIGNDFIEILKSTFRSEKIVILPEAEYEDLTREKRNNEYLEKLTRAFRELEEGKGIVMTMEQMAALEHE
ncbi:MAG: hypothetical protein LBT16_05450 [Treponema sp.]|jgi:hypothetical protein|nr:hypothetical protein [Treponema sp.]